jgi:hypothetical protein
MNAIVTIGAACVLIAQTTSIARIPDPKSPGELRRGIAKSEPRDQERERKAGRKDATGCVK